MAHAQKPDFVFRRNGRVHLNRRGASVQSEQSALVMLDTPCSEVVWRVLATHSIRQFPLHFPSRASPCAITFQLDSTKALKITGINETWFRNTGTQSVTVVKIFVNSCLNLLFLTRPGHVGSNSQFMARNLLSFQLPSQKEISLRLSSRGSLCFDLQRKCPYIIIIIIIIRNSTIIISDYDRWTSLDKFTVQQHILHSETCSLQARCISYVFSSWFIKTVASRTVNETGPLHHIGVDEDLYLVGYYAVETGK